MKICKGMCKSFFSPNKGWILVDVLIGTVIIAVALVAISAAYRHSTVAMVDIRYRAEALALVEQKLECFKNKDGTTSAAKPPYNSGACAITTPVTGPSLTVFQVGYSEGAEISTVANPKGRLVPVTINVAWTEAQSGNQSLQVTQYLYYSTP